MHFSSAPVLERCWSLPCSTKLRNSFESASELQKKLLRLEHKAKVLSAMKIELHARKIKAQRVKLEEFCRRFHAHVSICCAVQFILLVFLSLK